MRLTVGPLPPAVYWRRRAVVLGAILLFVFVLTYSCAKSDNPAANTRAAEPTGASQNPAPTVAVRPSSTGVPAPSNGGSPTAAAPSDAATEPSGSPPAGNDPGTCTDDEI